MYIYIKHTQNLHLTWTFFKSQVLGHNSDDQNNIDFTQNLGKRIYFKILRK